MLTAYLVHFIYIVKLGFIETQSSFQEKHKIIFYKGRKYYRINNIPESSECGQDWERSEKA